MNVGTPGIPLGRIHWENLQLARRYGGTKATLQSFRANDLLGVAFAAVHADTRIRYIGYNPGVVATGMPNHLPQPLRTLTKASFAVFAASVAKAVTPMARLLEEPQGERFAIYRNTRQLPLKGKSFNQGTALRLHRVTQELLRTPSM
ncbi:hypothetical protein [Streptomyces silaceus]|uniref:hypothetical protein n=1 Tax=Streptomyces silaceus TaxID=545123 RepID=UPI000B0301DB|nr:hypothetical protein [Streptomyces silaceus]